MTGAAAAFTEVFGPPFKDPSLERQHGRDKPIVIAAESNVTDGLGVLDALFAAWPGQVSSPPAPSDYVGLRDAVLDDSLGDGDRWLEVLLSGGNDGRLPGATEYEGSADPGSTAKWGLKQFEDLEILSIIA